MLRRSAPRNDNPRLHPVALAPGEAFGGVAERRVFAANPARIAEFVDAAEHIFPADLAGAGLVPAGDIGELPLETISSS